MGSLQGGSIVEQAANHLPPYDASLSAATADTLIVWLSCVAVVFDQTTFISNLAHKAAGVMLRDSTKTRIIACRFEAGTVESVGAALAMDGDADMEVRHSAINHNKAPLINCTDSMSCGGALHASAVATVRLYNTTFMQNVGRWASAVWTMGDTSVNGSDLLLDGNVAAEGGTLLAEGKSNVALNASACVNNSALQGGCLCARQSATVKLMGWNVSKNRALQQGGGVYAEGEASITLQNSTVAGNIGNVMGGGLLASGTTNITMSLCKFFKNRADAGGAVAMFQQSTLSLGTAVAVLDNIATAKGSGFALWSPHFNATQVKTATKWPAHVGKKVSLLADIWVPAQRIELPDQFKSHKEIKVVGRLDPKDGNITVPVRLSGHQGLPSAGAVIARFNGSTVQVGLTDKNGVARLSIPVRRPPGTYELNFSVDSTPDGKPVTLRVVVDACAVGDITASTGDACRTCDMDEYSFNPRNTLCDSCPLNASELGSVWLVMIVHVTAVELQP